MGIKFLAFYLKEPDTPSVQLVKSQVNELVLRAQAQKAFGVAESCTPLPQTQSASNSVGQEGVRRKTCPKNSFRWHKESLCYTGYDSIVPYCAKTLKAKIQTLPTGKRSISAMGWICLAHISLPQERPDCLVSGFTDLQHVGNRSNTTNSVQSSPLLRGRRAHCMLSPQRFGISWWQHGAQLQPVLPSPQILGEEKLH